MTKKKSPAKEKPKPISTMTTDSLGNKSWKNQKGKLHREDGPAVEYVFGRRQWFFEGKLHREDGPAWEDTNTRIWYKHGVLHRVGGPAREFLQGYDTGRKEWYQNGNLHREDGPAITDAHGTKHYYLNNVCFTEEQFLIQVKEKKMVLALKAIEDFADKYLGSKQKEKAGLAVMQFLGGDCEHLFKNDKGNCELCDPSIQT